MRLSEMQILRPHSSESQTSITHQNYLAHLLEHRVLGPILIHGVGGWCTEICISARLLGDAKGTGPIQ